MLQTTTTLSPMLVTIRAAARLLSLGESTMYAMVASGEIPHVPVGRVKRIAVADIETWIDQTRKRAA